MVFIQPSLCLALGAVLAAAPQGQTIDARGANLVVVSPTADVRLVRRGDANVRAIFDAARRSLILLVDYVSWDGHEPDDRVDATFRFYGVEGEWPLDARWQGRAILEDYSLIGMPTLLGIGLRTQDGLVQILGGPPALRAAERFAQKPALAALSFRSGGRSNGGEVTFAIAEAREVEIAARTVANPGTVSSGLTFMINGVPAVPSSGSPATYPPPGAPVRVGGNIRTPPRIVDAAPVMPEVARQAGIRGVVILEIVIGVDGKVTDAKVLRSIPLLDQAAIDAALQWRYAPTLLNGAPVPVIMTATVNFQ